MLTGNRTLRYDEFTTVIAEAADVVNNTPLWAVSADPNDPMPLCPNDLLRPRDGELRTFPEEYSDQDLCRYGRLRYRKVQYLVNEFWSRWRNEYVQTLTARRKWTIPRPSLKKGDVVLVIEKNLKRNDWPTGVITELRYGKDKHVRSATVRLGTTKSSRAVTYLTRPISKMVMLAAA